MKILALGAHPDDIEIFMYGLLKTLKNRGDEIFTMIATDGAKGGNVKEEKLIKIRKEEAINGLKNLSTPVFLDLPDGELGSDNSHQKIIKENILKIMPDLIVTHSRFDYHVDHRSLSLLSSNAISHYIPILYCDTLMGIHFQPVYYIEITNFFEMKKEAVLSHKTQNPKRFIDLIELMNSYRAAQCNLPKGFYAEGYSFTSSFPFSDIRNLLPPAPKIRPFHIQNHHGFL